MKKSDRPKQTSKAKAKRPAPAGQSSRALLDLAAGIGRTEDLVGDASAGLLRLLDESQRLREADPQNKDADKEIGGKVRRHLLKIQIQDHPDDMDLLALRAFFDAEDYIDSWGHDRVLYRLGCRFIDIKREIGIDDEADFPEDTVTDEIRAMWKEWEDRKVAIKKEFLRHAGLSDEYIENLYSMKGTITLYHPTTEASEVHEYDTPEDYLFLHALSVSSQDHRGKRTMTGEAIH